MRVTKIFSYLTNPEKKAEEKTKILGTSVPLRGKLFTMLNDIFERSDHECNIPIAFLTDGETQENKRRSQIVQLVESPSLMHGRPIADELQSVTNLKSGMGLLFLILGEQQARKKLIISRFPADNGVMANVNRKDLEVEFIERVFMKNSTSYKAASYSGSSSSDFWEGTAIDKQINTDIKALSNYWIRDFLLSDFKTTPAAGTRRLAMAIQEALSNTREVSVKQELVAAATLARGRRAKAISIQDFCDEYELSEAAQQILVSTLASRKLKDDRFVFDPEEFSTITPFRSLELDNGAIVTAPTDTFQDIFSVEVVNENNLATKFRLRDQ